MATAEPTANTLLLIDTLIKIAVATSSSLVETCKLTLIITLAEALVVKRTTTTTTTATHHPANRSVPPSEKVH